MVEPYPSKLMTRVRFPSPAPTNENVMKKYLNTFLFLILSALILLVAMPVRAQTYQENYNFELTQKSVVQYGTSSKYVVKELDIGTYRCDNALFTDPAQGDYKSCIVLGTLTTNTTGGKSLILTKSTKITYGSGSKWTTKDLPAGKHLCNNNTFGSDPNPGVAKRCSEVRDIFACYPSQVPGGTGSKAFLMKDATGCVAAWYCQGKEYPVLLVGTPAKCNLSAIGTFVAGVAIGQVTKTTSSSNEFLAQNATANVWTDPTLVAIWMPHLDSIVKMADGYFK